MGQKVHPIGFRLGISKPHLVSWFAETKDFGNKLVSDLKLRTYINKTLKKEALVSKVIIGRTRSKGSIDKIEIYIYAAKPAVILGRSNERIAILRQDIATLLGSTSENINILPIAVRKVELDATLVAMNIADQLENRIAFRRAMRRAVNNTMRAGAKGVKIKISGRLSGADIARAEWQKEGRVPLHTLKADVDYAMEEAHTTYGVIGVKVWIYIGDIDPGQHIEIIPVQETQNASAK